jgi:hypothetical protein
MSFQILDPEQVNSLFFSVDDESMNFNIGANFQKAAMIRAVLPHLFVLENCDFL